METGIVIGIDSMPTAIGSRACNQPTGSGSSLFTILQYRKPRKRIVKTVDTTDIVFMCIISFFLIAYYSTESAFSEDAVNSPLRGM